MTGRYNRIAWWEGDGTFCRSEHDEERRANFVEALCDLTNTVEKLSRRRD